MRRIRRAAGVLALALVVACTGGGSELTLREADNGAVVTVDAGQRLRVVLKSNQSTPYRWVMRSAPSDRVLIQMGDASYLPGSTGKIGEPGHEVWEFQAVASGTTTIGLSYESLGTEPRPIGSWSATVTVR